MDTITDSERFYTSVLDLFEDAEEIQEVNELQMWWNRCVFFSHVQIAYKWMLCSQVFPNFSSARRTICKNSALARIKAKRAELRSIGNNST